MIQQYEIVPIQIKRKKRQAEKISKEEMMFRQLSSYIRDHKKITLLCFSSSDFLDNDGAQVNSFERISREAEEFGIFQNVILLTEKDLPEDFQKTLQERIDSGFKRGYAYYSWKPYIVSKYLSQMKEDEYLLYIDIGCGLRKEGIVRMKYYLDLCDQNYTGTMAFVLDKPGYDTREILWTKHDLYDYVFSAYSIQDEGFKNDILQSSQLCATSILMRKCQKSQQIADEWNMLSQSRFDLITDIPSNQPEAEGFVQPRHDQSLFSLIGKIHLVAKVSDRDCYYSLDKPIVHHLKFQLDFYNRK